MENGVRDIKAHPYFSKIDWTALLNRQIKAPFIPNVKAETDVSNVDPEFLSEPP